MKIRLEKFSKKNYTDLISWVDSEETLMQFAGPLFTFPLTHEQLDASLADQNRIAFTVIDDSINLPVGHAEIYLSDHSAKIGRILIGKKELRGKGLGQQMVNLLLRFAFFDLQKNVVELNVFDWNIAAIKCYEKTGFAVNPGQTLERKIKEDTWIAVNMTIDKVTYKDKMSNKLHQ